MEAKYNVVLDGLEYEITASIFRDSLNFQGRSVNVIPQYIFGGLVLPKIISVSTVANRYADWLMAKHAEVQKHIKKSTTTRVCTTSTEVIAKFDKKCTNCAYWGSDTDTGSERVCKFWDIPERTCMTNADDFCSKGFVLSEHAESPVKCEPSEELPKMVYDFDLESDEAECVNLKSMLEKINALNNHGAMYNHAAMSSHTVSNLASLTRAEWHGVDTDSKT